MAYHIFPKKLEDTLTRDTDECHNFYLFDKIVDCNNEEFIPS